MVLRLSQLKRPTDSLLLCFYSFDDRLTGRVNELCIPLAFWVQLQSNIGFGNPGSLLIVRGKRRS